MITIRTIIFFTHRFEAWLAKYKGFEFPLAQLKSHEKSFILKSLFIKYFLYQNKTNIQSKNFNNTPIKKYLVNLINKLSNYQIVMEYNIDL